MGDSEFQTSMVRNTERKPEDLRRYKERQPRAPDQALYKQSARRPGSFVAKRTSYAVDIEIGGTDE